MVAIAAPFIGMWEGKRNNPYLDSVGVKTVCYGETRVPMRHYTDAQCTALLENALVRIEGAGEGAEPLRALARFAVRRDV